MNPFYIILLRKLVLKLQGNNLNSPSESIKLNRYTKSDKKKLSYNTLKKLLHKNTDKRNSNQETIGFFLHLISVRSKQIVSPSYFTYYNNYIAYFADIPEFTWQYSNTIYDKLEPDQKVKFEIEAIQIVKSVNIGELDFFAYSEEQKQKMFKSELLKIETEIQNTEVITEFATRFSNTQWYLYYLHDEIICLARAVLTIKPDFEIEINNDIQYSSDTKKYHGKVKWSNDIMILNLKDTEKSKVLHILIKTGRGNVSLMVGMWHNINAKGHILGGTVLLEKKNITEKISPEVFYDVSIMHQKVHPAICKYFQHKNKNLIKQPRDITSLESLQTFFENRIVSQTDGKVFHKYDIFISAPIFSVKYRPFTEVKRNINTIVEKIKNSTDFKNIYFAGEQINNVEEHTKKMLDKTLENDVQRAFEDSKYVFAIVQSKETTGTFVEIGMALSAKKKVLIFTKNVEFLPNMIRNLDKKKERNLQIVVFNTIDDIIDNIEVRKSNLFSF